jgi:hypothetical protein
MTIFFNICNLFVVFEVMTVSIMIKTNRKRYRRLPIKVYIIAYFSVVIVTQTLPCQRLMTTSHSSSETKEKLPKDVPDETSVSAKYNPGPDPHVSNIRNI